MSHVMLRLGAYGFSVSTAAYQQFTRNTQQRWAAHERLGTNAALQYTGPGPDTISLSGVVFPEYEGGTMQVTLMRAQAELGVPLPLIDGRGFVLGLWVVEEISETQSIFAIKGVGRRQEFDMRLTRYSPSLAALAKSYIGGIL